MTNDKIVVYGAGGRPNFKLLYDNGLKDEIVQLACVVFERLRDIENHCRKVNGGVPQIVAIIDYQGMTFRKALLPDSKSDFCSLLFILVIS